MYAFDNILNKCIDVECTSDEKREDNFQLDFPQDGDTMRLPSHGNT